MKKLMVGLIAVCTLFFALNTYSIANIIPPPPPVPCDKGCTPGYWKQPHHFDSWNYPYVPEKTLQQAFGCGGSTTLLEALEANGGGIYALQRHAVAALLNAAEFPCFKLTEQEVKAKFCAALSSVSLIETKKDLFEDLNDAFCPLQ